MTQNLGNLFIDGEDVIEDETGNHTIINNNGVTLDTNIKQFNNSSMYFNGSSYLTVSDHPDFAFGSESFTIDCWLHMTTDTGMFDVVSKRDGVNNATPYMIFSAGGQLYFYGSEATEWDIASKPLGPVALNTWLHLAVVRNGDSWYCFRNGILTDSWTQSITLLTSTATLKFGALVGYPTLTGYMDNIRITKGTALWTEAFNVEDPDAMFYASAAQENPYIRPDTITGLYNLSYRGNLRGKAGEGFVRPTIKQFFTSTDFEEIESTLSIGDSYEGGYYMGILGGYELICSPITGQNESLFLKTTRTTTVGTASEIDGYANTQAMITAGIAVHPAANFCVGLTIGGFSDWYMPAIDELYLMYQNKAALEAGGTGSFLLTFYRSSSESDVTRGKTQHFSTGEQTHAYKNYGYPVRAIRRVAI